MPSAETGREVSIIVACRNEEASIGACLTKLTEALPEAEILVVDGGTDGTFDIASSMALKHPLIIPIRNENDRGKGHAIKTGIARASHDVMAQFDADMQFLASDVPRILAPVVAGSCDLCLGSRFLSNSDRGAYQRMPARDLGNRIVSLFVSSLIGHRVTDVTAGVKAWTRSAITAIDFHDDAYSYEAEMVVRAGRLGLRIMEMPVSYASRLAGESMHKNTLALARAGLTILAKSLAARLRRASAE